MQRLINTFCEMVSRLFDCGCHQIVGVVGHPAPAAVALSPARSSGMRRPDGLGADLRVTYYVATRAAAALLRQFQKPSRNPRAAWRSPQPKRTEPRTTRR